MKKIALFISIVLVFGSCEDFLDTEPTNLKTIDNYPSTQAEATQVLTGIYSILSRPDPLQTSFFTSELRSDDRIGGGDKADISTKAIAQCQKWSESNFAGAWRANYMGIFRANVFLESMEKVKWNSEEDRKRMEGETRFLRAHYYFDLSRMFGNVCLLTSSATTNVPRSPAAETYALIASDLKTAIEELLPIVKYNEVESGRITKWAAEALMARVFLFYTGYYQTETLPLPGGGEVTKAQVIAWLDECTNTVISGHDLVEKFGNLWPYSVVQDYNYTKNNGLNWAGDGNKESVFAIKFSNSFANDEFPFQESNQIAMYCGLRGQSSYGKSGAYPFGRGWGFGTVNPKTWNDWPDEDIRKNASIFTVTDRKEVVIYNYGGERQIDETTFFQKKYIPISMADPSGAVVNYSNILYGNTVTDFKYCNTQDLVLIRFADVLLMAAELNLGTPKAQGFLDRVRNRVNLTNVSATLENIKKERRFELAFEGVRFYDLLRWHDEQVLNENQKDITIYLSKTETTKKTITYRPETQGFLQIPLSEMELQKGALTPNPGWGPEATYQDIY